MASRGAVRRLMACGAEVAKPPIALQNPVRRPNSQSSMYAKLALFIFAAWAGVEASLYLHRLGRGFGFQAASNQLVFAFAMV